MKTLGKIALAAVAGTVLVTGVMAVMKQTQDEGQIPLPSSTTAGSVELLYAQPFTVAEPFTHWWRVERPQVSSGYLLVLSVDRDYVFPRQTAEPVLYVGAQTAERVNVGADSGHVIAIVPGDLDLADALMFFGSPALPEEIGAAQIADELAQARASGVQPPSADLVASVMHEPVHFDNDFRLRRYSVDLIEQYSPDEIDLINGLRVPVIGE